MKTSRQIKREARRLFRLCLVNGILDERRAQQVVRAVIAAKRRGGYALLANFLRWVKIDRLRHTATVESAGDLSAELRASIVVGLLKVYGPGVNASFSQNPALIGGMRIRVASDLYDGSIRARLAAIERQFGNGAAH